MGMQKAQPCREAVWLFLRKLNVLSPFNPITALLGVGSNGLKTYVCTDTCL